MPAKGWTNKKKRQRKKRAGEKAGKVKENPQVEPSKVDQPPQGEPSKVEPPKVDQPPKDIKAVKSNMTPCWVPALSTPAQMVQLAKDANCTIAQPAANKQQKMRHTLSNNPTASLARYLLSHLNPGEEDDEGSDNKEKGKPAGLKKPNTLKVEYIEAMEVTKEGKLRYRAKLAGKDRSEIEWYPGTALDADAVSAFMSDYSEQLTQHIKAKGTTWGELLQGERPAGIGQFEWVWRCTPDDFEYICAYKCEKRKQRVALRSLEDWLNRRLRMQPCITIVNEVDLEILPINFRPIDISVAGDDIIFPTNEFQVHCQCESGCEVGLRRDTCCPSMHGVRHMYDDDGLAKYVKDPVIYECNESCPCDMDCPNRVVQKGRYIPLSVFRTADGRGWGVKTLEMIPKGSFVIEYVGEVITNDEAESRGKKYDGNGMTYLFDLDYFESTTPLSIDATKHGNMSRFINHSCSPNMLVYNVWIEFSDPSLQRVAFFASRDIPYDEEITFDYRMSLDKAVGSSKEQVKCLCGAPNCRGLLIS